MPKIIHIVMINYNKRQMQPLLNKYMVDPEKDTWFKWLTELFEDNPHYQYWAMSVHLKNPEMSCDEFSKIKEWIDENKQFIRTLSRGNIVSYRTEDEIRMLKNEMKSISIYRFIKGNISRFNTMQRAMLVLTIYPEGVNTLKDYESTYLSQWVDIFRRFDSLTEERKKNFISNVSSINDIDELVNLIESSSSWEYEWTKDSFMSFMRDNPNGCVVVYDNGPYVIVRVPDFEASLMLAGGGRTKWCIAKEKEHFENFVGEASDQYFIFDFSRPETDSFAHVAFTIDGKSGCGITFAQTCENISMLSDFCNGDETYNIWSFLEKIGASLSIFFRQPTLFDWNRESILKFVSSKSEKCELVYDKDGYIIFETPYPDMVGKVFGHTMMVFDDLIHDEEDTFYILLNTNVPFNEKQSGFILRYKIDEYGVPVKVMARNSYSETKKVSEVLDSFGINEHDFIEFGEIPDEIKFHRYIDERNEDGAVRFLESRWDGFNVECRYGKSTLTSPVYKALSAGMYGLCEKIMTHPSFRHMSEVMGMVNKIYNNEYVKKTEEDVAGLSRLIKKFSGEMDGQVDASNGIVSIRKK